MTSPNKPKPPAVPSSGGIRFLGLPALAGDLNSCQMTVKRLARTDPEFPKFTILGGRYHVTVHDWERYKQVLIARGTTMPPLATGMRRGGSPSRPRKVAAEAVE